MPKFSIDYKIPHSAQDGYKKIKKVLSDGGELKKFDSNIQCTFDDPNKTLSVKGAQFKAEMAVQDKGDDESNIAIKVDIPFLLMPFKSKITESLQKMLQKHFG
ncbi:MAG: polyhydroxyalkanoic acid system family protein [Bdellovibrionota bacterium]